MIHFITGNILDSTAEALINTVNTVGVMGKGIALQFKNQFPNNYKIYKKACDQKELKVGELLVTEEDSLLGGKKIIINFPTKTHWRMPSEYEYIQSGLKALVKLIEEKKIKSVAVPPLGAGNGGLDWNRVKPIIIDALQHTNCEVHAVLCAQSPPPCSRCCRKCRRLPQLPPGTRGSSSHHKWCSRSR